MWYYANKNVYVFKLCTIHFPKNIRIFSSILSHSSTSFSYIKISFYKNKGGINFVLSHQSSWIDKGFKSRLCLQVSLKLCQSSQHVGLCSTTKFSNNFRKKTFFTLGIRNKIVFLNKYTNFYTYVSMSRFICQ